MCKILSLVWMDYPWSIWLISSLNGLSLYFCTGLNRSVVAEFYGIEEESNNKN